MMLIISPEKTRQDETAYVNTFFQLGLDLFHVRKYDFSRDEMEAYLEAIDKEYRSQLVLHSHYELADSYGIERLHFGEMNRKQHIYKDFAKYMRSTSVHGIDDFNALEAGWDYAFLSPVFPSISKKGYGDHHSVLSEIGRKHNPSIALIALGGIGHYNLAEVLAEGADGVALLGSIWQSEDPLIEYIKCRQIGQLY